MDTVGHSPGGPGYAPNCFNPSSLVACLPSSILPIAVPCHPDHCPDAFSDWFPFNTFLRSDRLAVSAGAHSSTLAFGARAALRLRHSAGFRLPPLSCLSASDGASRWARFQAVRFVQNLKQGEGSLLLLTVSWKLPLLTEPMLLHGRT